MDDAGKRMRTRFGAVISETSGSARQPKRTRIKKQNADQEPRLFFLQILW